MTREGTLYRVVTTMNHAGWKETGERMVASFRRHWPEDVELIVHAEDFEVDERPGVTVRRLPEWLDELKARHEQNPAAHGEAASVYDYRFDAVKFAHKVAALTDEGFRQSRGVLIWLDADTFTHAPVTAAWLDRLFPAPAYVAWLDRENHYPECGFIMLRCDHRAHRAAMAAYRDLYASDRVFGLRETHDSFVFQHLIDGMVRAGEIETPVSLSGDRTSRHPFVNGPLGACLDHMKGPRKQRGRSDAADLTSPRPEPYWQASRGGR